MERDELAVYAGREQTHAKHFILKRYLQELAFKVLTFSDITYVDGFSGPWETKTEDFSDSSFMIAIAVLREAQRNLYERTRIRRRIRCFFSENNPKAHQQLAAAVAPYHDPAGAFEIETFSGNFEDAVLEIKRAIGGAFALIFIDPTGWTGYPLQKIRPIFEGAKREVLINFMYDFVNRFVASEDETIVTSLDPILGGPGWRSRLDESLPRGLAVEKLFRETLKREGDFRYVVSTKVDKRTADRPHFFLAYGTKNPKGLKAFRETEYSALRHYARSRAKARDRKREETSNVPQLFPEHDAEVQADWIDEIIEDQKTLASAHLLRILAEGRSLRFADVVVKLLEAFMLRETNVKDLCLQLASDGAIANTWSGRSRKPHDSDLITTHSIS